MAKKIKNCISLDDIDDRLNCSGTNSPGIIQTVIYGYHADVAVWPDEPKMPINDADEPVSLEDAGKLVGDIIMKPGTRAYSFEMTRDSGNFAITFDGDAGSFSVIQTLTLVRAKIDSAVLGFINATSRRGMFFIVEDENETRYLMGRKKRPAYLESGSEGATTGTGSGDRNQTSLQFQFRSGYALTYEGDTEDLLVPAPDEDDDE